MDPCEIFQAQNVIDVIVDEKAGNKNISAWQRLTFWFRNFCYFFEGFGFGFEKFGLGKKVSVSEKFGLGKKSRFRKIWYRKKSLGIGFGQNFGIVIQ